MAGTAKGCIEQNLASTETEIVRNWFVNTYVYMSQSSDFELHASNWDSGGEPPGATEPGNKSWFVFKWGAKPGARRQFDCYIYIQYHPISQTLTTGVSNPCTIQRSTNPGAVATCGMAVGMTVSGGVTPWNGTANGDGSDTKGTPVWKATGSFAYFPWTNASGNIDYTNDMRDTFYFGYFDNNTSNKAHFIHDDDFMFWSFDNTKNLTYGVGGFGYFTPRNDMTGSSPQTYSGSFPCIHFNHRNVDASGWQVTVTHLNLPNVATPSTTTHYGGVIMPSGAQSNYSEQYYTNRVTLVLPDLTFWTHNTNMHANTITQKFDTYSAMVVADDTSFETGYLGVIGLEDDLFQLIYGRQSHDTTPFSSSAVIGDNTTTETQGLIKWPAGGVSPGVGTNISGVIVN